MKVKLTSDVAGTWLLTLLHSNNRPTKATVLIQSDWDFPHFAKNLGWNGKLGNEECKHLSTDGTVNCNECLATPSQFIMAATEWLNEHDGDTFDAESAIHYFE